MFDDISTVPVNAVPVDALFNAGISSAPHESSDENEL